MFSNHKWHGRAVRDERHFLEGSLLQGPSHEQSVEAGKNTGQYR